MKLLINESEIKSYKSGEKNIPCECYCCSKSFLVDKREVNRALKGETNSRYCSRSCKATHQRNLNGHFSLLLECSTCGTGFKMVKSNADKSKSGKNFCSKSCACSYNNAHKKYGTRRSKFEKYAQLRIENQFPELEIHFNRRDKILSELDIYIPTLNIAFEFNGIFHYKPIFGADKLSTIKANDQKKEILCKAIGVKLFCLDISSIKNFTQCSADPYISEISSIIEMNVRSDGVEPPDAEANTVTTCPATPTV